MLKSFIKKIIFQITDFVYMIRDKLFHFPHEIKIELTYDCNKNCDFCFNKNVISKSSNHNKEEMNLTTLEKLFNKLKKEHIKRIRLTGGEPLIKSNIIEILKLAKKNKLLVKLNTNGDFLTKEKSLKLSKYCNEILFSIHDLQEPHLDNLIQQILIFKEKGVVVKISTVATRENISKFHKFTKIIKPLKPDFWYWNYPIPLKTELITWKEILSLGEKIKNSNFKFKCVGIRFPLCEISKPLDKYIKGSKNCGPYDHLVVNPYGDIHLCNSFVFRLGSVNQNILKIWRHNKLVRKFKSHAILPKECRSCPKLKDCYGGCRFSAFIQTKKLNGKHPLMEIE